jgi:O-antigen/teichoic acid export membrane protein
MFKKNSLKGSTFLYGISILTERFLSFLIIPILTRSLGQELYGIWTQMIVTRGLLSVIILLGLPTAVVRFLAGEKDKQKISSLFHTMLCIVLLNAFLVIIFAFLFDTPLSKIMFGNVYFSKFVFLFGFFLAVEVLFELAAAFLRARYEIKLLSIYYFLSNGGRVIILFLGLVIFHLNLFQAILFIIGLQFFLFVFIYVKDIFNQIGLSISFTQIDCKEVFSFSLPLVPYSFLIWGNNFIDRYLILRILNIESVSVYAVAYSLSAIVGIFYSILGFTIYPRMATLWNNSDKIGAAETLRKGIEYYLFFAVPFIAFLTILSTPLVKLLSSVEYISNWQVVFCLSMGIGTFGLYQLYVYTILLANKVLFNLNISVFALFSNIVLNLILIPKMGILGAAIATFLSNSILAFSAIVVGKRYLPLVFPWSAITKIIIATLVMSIFLLIARHYFDLNKFLQLVFTGIIATIIYGGINFANKNPIFLQLRKNI